MDDKVNSLYSIIENRREIQYKSKLFYHIDVSLDRNKLITFRKEKERKNRIEEYFYHKRLEYTKNKLNDISILSRRHLNNEIILLEDDDYNTIQNFISVQFSFSNEPYKSYFIRKKLYIQIFHLLEKNDNLNDNNLLPLLKCLNDIILFNNEEIYDEMRNRGLIHTLLKFISSDNSTIIEETVFSITSILSYYKYDSLKYYGIEIVLSKINELLNRKTIPSSVIKLCFSLIITIAKGEFNSKEYYIAVLKNLWNEDISILLHCLSTVRHMCEDKNMREYILSDLYYNNRIIEILMTIQHDKIRKETLNILELLFNTCDFLFYETIINRGILQLFNEILNHDDSESAELALNFILNMSNTTISIINSLVKQSNLLPSLYNLLSKSLNKPLLYELLFNLLYNGDSYSSISLVEARYLDMINSFFNEKIISVSCLVLAVNTINKLVEFDEYRPFFKEAKIKEIFKKNNLIEQLEGRLFMSNFPYNQMKLVEELLFKLNN